MPRLLLLYDMDERDFARDIFDFLVELDIDVMMIPRALDGGLTLQGKEEKYFDEAEAMLFLITPGAERHGKQQPSASVADEMGQAKREFKDESWRIIYLVDKECSIQSVDQRAYIDFARNDHRSVVEAMRRLVAALKDAAVLPGRVPPPPEKPPNVDIVSLARDVAGDVKGLLLHLATRPSGTMGYADFVKAAGVQMGNQTDGNLVVQDVMKGLVAYRAPGVPGQVGVVFPSPVGWDLVRFERARRRFTEAAVQKRRRDAEWSYRYRMKLVGDDGAMSRFCDDLSRLAGEYRVTRPISAGGMRLPFVDLLFKTRVDPKDLDVAAERARFDEAGNAVEVGAPGGPPP